MRRQRLYLDVCCLNRPTDALHIASAESADCDVMLSTDDRLLKKAGQNAKALKVRVENPLQWLLEQDDDANDPR